MTKEELKKEAQEQVNCCTPLYPECFIQGYLAGAEPREKRIEELEKENAELKEHHKSVCESLTNTHRNIREQLTKAKELLELFVQWNYGCCKEPDYKDIVKQAEQFLKE